MAIWNKQLQLYSCLLLVSVLTRFFPGVVTADTVVIGGCGSLVNNAPVTINATLNASSSGTCNLQSLTKAVFRVIRTNGQADDLCTLDISSGCNTTTQPGGCVCKSLVGDLYTFELSFTYDPSKYQGGTLDLEPNCFPIGDFANRATCTNLQAVDRCSGITCNLGATCSVDSNNQPNCNCDGTFHYGQRCEKNACGGHSGSAMCAVEAKEPSVPRYICSSSFWEGPDCEDCSESFIAFIIVICFLVVFLIHVIVFIVYIFTTALVIEVCVDFDPKIHTQPCEEEVITWVDVTIKEVCCCFGCCVPYSVVVRVLACGLVVVTTETRVAMLVLSPKLTLKIKDKIGQWVLNTDRSFPRSAPSTNNSFPQPHEPPTDYPLRELK